MNHANLTFNSTEIVNPFNESMLVGKAWRVDRVTSIDCMIAIGNKTRCGMGPMPAHLFTNECDIAFRNSDRF